MGTVGHVSDIGGTKDSLRAREIYEEGFQIPPMKLYEAGVPNETLCAPAARERAQPRAGAGRPAFLRRRQRARRRAAARLHARLRHARSAGARRRGAGPLREGDARRDRAPSPTASITSEIWNNPLGTPLRYPLKLTVEGRHDRGRFRRRAAATAARRAELHAELHGGARDLSAEMHADARRARQCRLLPAVHASRRRRARSSTARRPASVNIRTRTGWYIAPNIFRALADAAPDRGAGLHRPAGRGEHLRPDARTAASIPTCCSSAAARARSAPRRRQVRPALADLGRQHLDRAVRDARAGAGAGEDLLPDTGGPGASAAASASASAAQARR